MPGDRMSTIHTEVEWETISRRALPRWTAILLVLILCTAVSLLVTQQSTFWLAIFFVGLLGTFTGAISGYFTSAGHAAQVPSILFVWGSGLVTAGVGLFAIVEVLPVRGGLGDVLFYGGSIIAVYIGSIAITVGTSQNWTTGQISSYTTVVFQTAVGFLIMAGLLMAITSLLSTGQGGPSSISSIGASDPTSPQTTFLGIGSFAFLFWLARWVSENIPIEVFCTIQQLETGERYQKRINLILILGLFVSLVSAIAYGSLPLLVSDEVSANLTESVNTLFISLHLFPVVWGLTLLVGLIGISITAVRRTGGSDFSNLTFYAGPGLIALLMTLVLAAAGVEEQLHTAVSDSPLLITETTLYMQMYAAPGGLLQALVALGAGVSIIALKAPAALSLVSRIGRGEIGVATAAICLCAVTIGAAFQGRPTTALLIGGAGVILIWELGSYTVSLITDIASPVDTQQSSDTVALLSLAHLFKTIVVIAIGMVVIVPLWIMGTALEISPVQAILVAFVGAMGIAAVLYLLSKEFDGASSA